MEKENLKVKEVSNDNNAKIKEDHTDGIEITDDEDEILPEQNGRNEIPLNEELEAAMRSHRTESVEDIPGEIDTPANVESSSLTVASSPTNKPVQIQSSSSPRDIFMPLISKFRSGSTDSSPKKSKVFYLYYIPAHPVRIFAYKPYAFEGSSKQIYSLGKQLHKQNNMST